VNVLQQRQMGLYRKYENFLETRYPKAYRIHRLIVDGNDYFQRNPILLVLGCRSCAGDIKGYFLISRDLRKGTRSIGDLSKTELLSYIQVF
jgi:hypothetical protein